MTEFMQQITNGLMTGGTYAVVALGFGLVFSIMHVVNFAHPGFVMIGGYGAYLAGDLISDNFIVLIIGAVLASLIVGLIVERLAIRPTRGKFVLVSFVATIGAGMVLTYGIQRIFGVNSLRVSSSLEGSVKFGGLHVSDGQLLVFILSLLVAGATTFYVRGTRWGRGARAVAENHVVASALGVNINRVSVLTVGLSAVLAGVAGAGISISQGNVTPFMGEIYGLKSFVAMLVAGNRHIEGIIGVAFVLGILEALVAGYVSSSLRDVVAFGVLIVVLYIRPSGLFGSYAHH